MWSELLCFHWSHNPILLLTRLFMTCGRKFVPGGPALESEWLSHGEIQNVHPNNKDPEAATMEDYC
jgi:hypothetical protein